MGLRVPFVCQRRSVAIHLRFVRYSAGFAWTPLSDNNALDLSFGFLLSNAGSLDRTLPDVV
jgi:hypothetical protein